MTETMSGASSSGYRVLARKYRPRTFADLIGQEAMVRTLVNAFANDRHERRIKEIYMADYDGANPRRLTVNRSLNITPVWSPDGKAIAYTSYRRNNAPDVFVSYIYEGRPPETPAHGTDRVHNFLPASARRLSPPNWSSSQRIYFTPPSIFCRGS